MCIKGVIKTSNDKSLKLEKVKEGEKKKKYIPKKC